MASHASLKSAAPREARLVVKTALARCPVRGGPVCVVVALDLATWRAVVGLAPSFVEAVDDAVARAGRLWGGVVEMQVDAGGDESALALVLGAQDIRLRFIGSLAVVRRANHSARDLADALVGWRSLHGAWTGVALREACERWTARWNSVQTGGRHA